MDSTAVMVATKTVPKITLTEPFEEYARTGFLFGCHKDHYLRSTRDYIRSGYASEVTVASHVNSVMELNKGDMARARAEREAMVKEMVDRENEEEADEGEKEAAEGDKFLDTEWEGEGLEVIEIDIISTGIEEDTSELETTDLDAMSEETRSMAIAKKHYGILNEVDMMRYKPHQSALVDMLYENDKVGKISTYLHICNPISYSILDIYIA